MPDSPIPTVSSRPAAAEQRSFAERAFLRAAGADPIDGNAVRVLLDAQENFPAWEQAIDAARHVILFEMYIFENDALGRTFAERLAARARAGVQVLVLCDWLGSWRSGALWRTLRAAGAQVRLFNPPHFASPFGWLSRDHRKTIVVDGRVGFVSGLCVSAKWYGNPARRLEPWRDTGVEIRGPAVAALEQAFAQAWQASGGGALPAPPQPQGVLAHCTASQDAAPQATPAASMAPIGDIRLRVIAGAPSATGTFRLDLSIASLARQQLWLTDAYFIGSAPYVQALAAAARDGVDVRLLVPGASDIPAISPLSRAGYRPLLEAGVRVFEWNGTMLHAKTAVADGVWSRIGSTNLNIASWMQNYELDVAIEDAGVGAWMARQYERDLERSTEIVLTQHNRVRRTERRRHAPVRRAHSGSAGRAAAGAVSVGSALGAALTDRRVLAPTEAGVIARLGLAAIALGIVAVLWPALLAWPVAVLSVWFGLAWLVKAAALRRQRRAERDEQVREPARRDSAAP